MRRAYLGIVASVPLLAAADCGDHPCDAGALRCDEQRLQTCIDPAGGERRRWITVVNCADEYTLAGIPLGSCYDCADGVSVCDVTSSGCDAHGGVAPFTSCAEGRCAQP